MEIQTITTEKMEALKALADANVAVSEIKNNISKLKSEEADYIADREKKALAKIDKIFAESVDVLNKSFSNYEEIAKFASEIQDLSQFVVSSVDLFNEVSDIFENYVSKWETNQKIEEKKLIEIQKQIKNDKIDIEKEKKLIKAANKNLEEEQRKLVDRKAMLARDIERLKQNRT